MADGSEIDDVPPDVTLADVLRFLKRALELGLRVAMPGRVLAYDPATQTAQISLELLPVLRSSDAPAAPTVLPKVPVAWPSTAAACLTLPLAPGDTGLVVFADRSLGEWLSTGIASDPKAAHAHALSDGVFFPGLHATTNPIVPPTDLTAAVLEGPLVKLGRAAVQPAVLGTMLQTALTTFATAVASANTTWAGNPVTGPAFSTALGAALVNLATDLADILSAKVLVA